MNKLSQKIIGLLILTIFLSSTSCLIEEEQPTPTNQLMQGVWELTAAYDTAGNDITEQVTSIFPSYVHLDDNNSVNSTMGPLLMYIIYGNSKFVSVASQLDEAFGYANLELTEGEYFMNKQEVVDVFTIEMKLKFLTMQTLTSLLDLMGVPNPGIFSTTIYHKFINVNVTVTDENPNFMLWDFNANTTPVYNIKNEIGEYVSWNGVSILNFQHVSLQFTKKVETITTLVQNHNNTIRQ